MKIPSAFAGGIFISEANLNSRRSAKQCKSRVRCSAVKKRKQRSYFLFKQAKKQSTISPREPILTKYHFYDIFSLMKNRFDIAYGSMEQDFQARVIKNAMVIDPFANVEVFADLTPIHMAVIQNRLGSAGVLLAIGEPSQEDAIDYGHHIQLGFAGKESTDKQQETLASLAEVDIEEGESLPKELVETSMAVLPSLWFSDIAFMPDGLRFRNGNRHSQYVSALDHITSEVRDLHTQAHRETNARIRSYLSETYGLDMSQVPKPELDDQRRQRELDEINPEYSRMLAKAQELQLNSFDLTNSQFVIAVAKAHLAIQ